MLDPLAPIRAEVMAQPPAQRLDYALDLLRFYLDPLPEFYQGCARLGLCLSRRDCRVLHALDRRRGHYVSLDALQAAEMVDVPADGWGSHDSVHARISRIRRRISKARLPVAITSWREVGFKLDAAEAWTFEAGFFPPASRGRHQ